MLAVLLISTALASPLGSPVALPSHGALRGSVGLSAERVPSEASSVLPTVRTPSTSLRLDLNLAQGLGAWVGGSYRTASVSNSSYRGHGWSAGAGVRGAAWLLDSFALAAQVRGRYGLDWTRTDDGEVEGWYRRVAVRGALTAVVGPREGGAYAWAGARITAWGNEELDVASEGMSWDLGQTRRVGAVLGGEVHSDDLIGHGQPARMYASLGFEVHLVDVTGLGMWVGLAR